MEFQNAVLLATTAVASFAVFESRASSIAPRVAKRADPAPVPRTTPQGDLTWDRPISSEPSNAPQAARTINGDLILQRKLRDRYIAARFPCTAQSSADLENPDRMIQAARLFLEEEQPDRAMELLSLAIEQCPAVESLRLAQLEVAFRMGDAGSYRTLAMEFQKNHPASKDWKQVARLGRALAGTPSPAHDGPWPDTPNWIHASWDLTGEVLAADFHRAMNRTFAAGSR
ncbi:hypothetical protein DSM104443_02230 [Usitatibacter rugosus]|uniref:Tetratricopeptide repeat protein n=1 Tax=Usitatibacter rugosus TaxID=2732067 RepID=A0A6M4GWB1_9PROT|nr:hypothetical protein [Usitatibacter rugosus]QJR11158.1 hypothetical protein DSM104443_02230 [Usitatibacter rugosus]